MNTKHGQLVTKGYLPKKIKKRAIGIELEMPLIERFESLLKAIESDNTLTTKLKKEIFL